MHPEALVEVIPEGLTLRAAKFWQGMSEADRLSFAGPYARFKCPREDAQAALEDLAEWVLGRAYVTVAEMTPAERTRRQLRRVAEAVSSPAVWHSVTCAVCGLVHRFAVVGAHTQAEQRALRCPQHWQCDACRVAVAGFKARRQAARRAMEKASSRNNQPINQSGAAIKERVCAKS